jgi:hypothetical protein
LPLESVTVAGTAIAKETVLEMGGFHPGSPVDKAAIEAGCMKLEESGISNRLTTVMHRGPAATR